MNRRRFIDRTMIAHEKYGVSERFIRILRFLCRRQNPRLGDMMAAAIYDELTRGQR